MAIALLGLHFLIAALAPLGARLLGRRVFLLCALAPGATVLWAIAVSPGVLNGEPITVAIQWLPAIQLTISLLVDSFTLVMIALVSGIGTLIFLYSVSYFAHDHEEDGSEHDGGKLEKDLGRFAGRLLAFAGSMLGLVLADNVFVLYVFWELTSITSYLLIGHEDEKGSARAAAMQAILVTSLGGLVMLAGFVLLGQATGSYELSELIQSPPTGGLGALGALLVLVGAFTKSAQVPFHMWLPGAMVAPTPVSAYLHSATMVKAGVYLIARLAPALVVVAGWRPTVLAVGLATMLWGGARALRQHDLKLLLAFGTISQLGFMITLFGAGLGEATHAAVVLLLAHALFKATLFMVAGIIDHQTHTRDLRRLSGVGRCMPALAAVGIVAAASMAGLPPLFGFIAKEAAYETYVNAGLGPWGPVVLGGLVAGSMLTFAYSYRFVWGAFGTKPRAAQRGLVGPECPPPAGAFLAPPAVLMALTIAIGIVPASVDMLVNGAAQALISVEEIELALWHGFTLSLLLSAITIVVGVVLAAQREPVEQLQRRYGGWSGSQRAYERLVWLLNVVADRVTGIAQSGSLPVYLSVIVLTAVALSGSMLVQTDEIPRPSAFAEDPIQVVVGVAIIIAAFALATARQRFAAVLLIGAVGFGVAVLFVLQGAPDLALTQFLIETLSLVVFVLVLRHLPPTFGHHRWRLGQAFRRTVALLVGVFIFAFALIAGSARPPDATPVSAAFLERSVDEAGGHNVVNVILVDFRGFDTLGEITVLSVAGLGIAALVLASRRDLGIGEEPEEEREEPELVASRGNPAAGGNRGSGHERERR